MGAWEWPLAMMLLGTLGQPQALGLELVKNGSFQEADPSGRRPAGWTWPTNAEWVAEGGNRWIRLRDSASVGQVIELQPDWWKIEVSARVRCTDVQQGKEGWHDARLAMMFADEKGNRVGDWPPVLHWTGTFPWRTESKVFLIPQGAKRLHLECAIFQTKGVVEFDEVSVRVVALRPRLEDASLPPRVVVRWDAESAFRQETPTRGRLCINGLWQFHPDGEGHETPPPPGSGWGWLKAPASWVPGSGVNPIAPDIWEAEEGLQPARSLVAWYRREVEVPAPWQGRRLFLAADNVVREAEVFINGRRAGSLSWPDGRVEVTPLVKPGGRVEVALRVSALPLAPAEWAKLSPEERRQRTAQVGVRGLCGDVFLESEPRGPRIASVLVMPSVRRQELRLRLEVADVPEKAKVQVEAIASREGKVERQWRSPLLSSPPAEAPLEVAFPWPRPSLWDIDRPNLYTLVVRLLDEKGRLWDEFTPLSFGFREVWLEGRQVFLNGRPLHIRALNLQNPARDGGLASEVACSWALQRFRDLGMNLVYLSTYELDWGQLRYLDGLLEAADKMGFLVAVTMPHVRPIAGVYRDPERRAYWERVARWMARKAGNHPSVIAYAMNHNYLGYPGDQNPRYLDAGFTDEAQLPEWSRRGREAARWSEAFVKALDPARLVYHHQCGNFADWITLNCYLNWVPIQERMEWLSLHAQRGKKPLFFVEFGMPHHASFQRHRGAPFIWRNEVHAEPLNVEYAAILFGDQAYDLRPENLANYDTMAQVYARKGTRFFFWEVFGNYWAQRIEKDFLDVKAEYTRFTWPAFRTWGVAAISPWDWSDFGHPPKVREVPLKTDWERLQTPGLKPDVVRVEDWFQAPPTEVVEWTVLGRTLRPLNQDLLAYIAGKPERFTSRDHLFAPGEKVSKQAVFINDLPEPVVFRYRWRAEVAGKSIAQGNGTARVEPGGIAKVPLAFGLPSIPRDAPGELLLEAQVEGKAAPAVRGAQLRDAFQFRIVNAPAVLQPKATFGLLDPVGRTARMLRQLGVPFLLLSPKEMEKAPPVEVLIIGREALSADEAELWGTLEGTFAEAGLPPQERLKEPKVPRLPVWLAEFVRKGGRVLVCEQSARVLSQRFGFRVAWPGTRRVFVRCPWHPTMRGLDGELLSLWRGSSTLTLERTQAGPVGDPVVDWLGFPNTRVWKWGNYGTVASVVIEKPHRGDFLPIVDCEFDLNYSPLLEYRQGKGKVLFCQFDISERTEAEPVVRRLWANLLDDLSQPMAKETRRTLYAGGGAGERLLEALAVVHEPMGPAEVRPGDLLIVGPGAQEALRAASQRIAEAVREGAIVFGLGLGAQEMQGWLPFPVQVEEREVVFTPLPRSDFWLLRGLGPSEFHWRGRIALPALLEAPQGSFRLPTGVLGAVPFGKGWFVLCQVTPDLFDETQRPYLRLSRQRCAQMLSRLLANCGAAFHDPLLEHWTAPSPLFLNLSGPWRLRADPQGLGEKEGWERAEGDEAEWVEVRVPGLWEEQVPSLKGYDGVAWYRLRFRLPEIPPNEELELLLGAVDDEDWTYLNGHLIGHIGQDTHPEDYWAALRRYRVPPGLLRPGAENLLVVKVRDLRLGGGIVKGPVALRTKPRWLTSFYLNEPLATDDPYRYYRW